jgi:hypothetical protein
MNLKWIHCSVRIVMGELILPDVSYLLKSVDWVTVSHLFNSINFVLCMGQDGWVAVVTCYGLDGLRIESWWGQVLPQLSRLALGPTQPVWLGRGVNHPPLSSAEVNERVELNPPPPRGGGGGAFVACSRVNFTCTFTFCVTCLQLFIHTNIWQY